MIKIIRNKGLFFLLTKAVAIKSYGFLVVTPSVMPLACHAFSHAELDGAKCAHLMAKDAPMERNAPYFSVKTPPNYLHIYTK